jgi:lipoprotein NlpI
MMQIYALYQGKTKPDDVFVAAREGMPDERELNARLFYANLYVGLYYEAAGEAAKAQTHIIEAATKHPIAHYMGDVARVHQEMLQRSAKEE